MTFFFLGCQICLKLRVPLRMKKMPASVQAQFNIKVTMTCITKIIFYTFTIGIILLYALNISFLIEQYTCKVRIILFNITTRKLFQSNLSINYNLE